jgi:hypothetical protein
MPQFSYKARNELGKSIEGLVEANGVRHFITDMPSKQASFIGIGYTYTHALISK